MADGASKPSIPAWQRARQTPQETAPPKTDATAAKQAPGAEDSTTDGQEDTRSDASVDGVEAEESAPPPEGTSQLDMVEAFLADPTVKNAPLEKKRAFLQSKEIPVETIEQVLQPKASTFEASDFASFKQQQPPAKPTAQPQRQSASGPPIITYPEFLVQAHKSPPLITPGRILNATYIAGGLTTLAYGASKYLVNPMIEAMTEARHDFSTHSQSKLDELNDRLSKIVSHVPESKSHGLLSSDPEADDDVESVTSDPTELYHRDMGTQTSSLPSRRPSTPDATTTDAAVKKDAVTRQTTALDIMKSHLSELLDGADKQASSNKEAQESANKLRHYLDNMMYASPSVNVWGMGDEASKTASKSGQEDAIEELKKEIRGVKGVLLSARRFPAAGGVGRVGAGS